MFEKGTLNGTVTVANKDEITINVIDTATLLTVGAGAQKQTATLMVMQPTKTGVNFTVLCDIEAK